MQENFSPNPDQSLSSKMPEAAPATAPMSSPASGQVQPNKVMYFIGVVVVAIVFFGLSYFIGNAFFFPGKNNPQIIPDSEPMVADENAMEKDVMMETDMVGDHMEDSMMEDSMVMDSMEQDTIHEDGMIEDSFVYSSEELGFSLELPSKYKVLEYEEYNQEGFDHIEFYLPLELSDGQEGPTSQTVFSIQRVHPGSFESGPMSKKIAESNDGYIYLFFPALDAAVMPEQPEYEVFQDLISQNIYALVEEGFKLIGLETSS